MATAATFRSWRDAVLDAVTRVAGRRSSDTVDRQSLIAEELDRIVLETDSRGATPAQTLSRVLQDLRDEGVIDFLGEGSYRLLDAPVEIELVELSDEQIDAKIRRRLLRLGRVETGTDVGAARRRRGQARLRELTLGNYGRRCAVCDVSHPSLLVTSHILPWAEGPDARGDLSNVICLCRCHDSLFEVGYWALSDELNVLRRATIESTTIQALIPAPMAFRRPAIKAPSADYLRYHRLKHGFGPGDVGAYSGVR